ncbi:MAG: TolC family protein, partial [Flavobacteriales bacterium]
MSVRKNLMFILLLTMCGAPQLHWAQDALTREQAVAMALEQNLGIRMAKLEVNRAEIDDSWGAAGALPQIGLNVSGAGAVSDQSENPTSFIQERLESQSLNVGTQLNWVLFDGFGMFANKRALETLVEQAGGQVDVMIEQTLAGVLQLYDVAKIQEQLVKMWEEEVANGKDRVEWLERRREYGAAAAFDRIQLENAVIADELTLAQQRVALNATMRSLNRLIGADLSTTWKLTTELDEPEARDFQALEEALLQNNTAMDNARLGQELARIGMDQAKSRQLPSLQLSASQGNQRSQFAAGEFEGEGRIANVSANLILNFNLFNGGSTRRAIEQAKLQMLVAEQRVENEAEEVKRIFGDARDRWEVAASSFALSKRLRQNTEKAMEIAESTFQSGAMNSLDFRDVQLQLMQAKQAESQALQEWLAAEVELARLSGQWTNQ